MDDAASLLRAMARRERPAWAAMYERHVRDVFGVVYHLVGGDRGAAQEITQEVWVIAIERFDRFDSRRGEFRDWLVGIARHLAFRHYRRASSRRLSPDESFEGPSRALPAHEHLEGVERAGVVRAALLCLHADRRRVIRLKYVEELSVSEIADRIGRSGKAVETLLSKARKQLRELLKPYFCNPTGDERYEPSDARPI